MDKKAKEKLLNCNLPVFDYTNNVYVYSDGKEIYNAADLEMAYEEYIRFNCTYHYHAKVYEFDSEGNIIDNQICDCHGHSFDDVLHAITSDPYNFFIDEEDKKDYNYQQLEYIKRLQAFLIDIKYDTKDKLDVSTEIDKLYDELKKYNEDSEEAIRIQKEIDDLYTEKEIANSKNELAKKYFNLRTTEPKDDVILKNILNGKINYFISSANPKYYKSQVGEKILVRDKNTFHIVGILKITKDEIIKIEDLKLKNIPYELEGYKSLEDRIESFNKTIYPWEKYDGYICYQEFIVEEKL